MTESSQAKGTSARERLLALAETAVLEKGFAATSIDELIAGAGITKSGFFYHFKDKSELAKALMRRYIDENNTIFTDIFRRADQLNEDPLHGFLVALRLLASFVYQDQLLSREVRELTLQGVQGWRRLFGERLAAIAERYPPRIAINLDDLADMANTLVDGGIILSRLTRDKQVLPQQVLLYREFVRAVFLGS
jgi:TetR/AcrR family transcriptional repressor of nem operon